MIICPVCAAAVSSHHECTRRATHNSWPRYDPTPTDVLRPDKPYGASTTRPFASQRRWRVHARAMETVWKPCGETESTALTGRTHYAATRAPGLVPTDDGIRATVDASQGLEPVGGFSGEPETVVAPP